MAFRHKILYIWFIFALGAIGVLARLWYMQVADHETWASRAEATRARTELLFPARARILDADGRVLADGESVWDVVLDLYPLTHPERVLARAAASPEAYPPFKQVEQFHRDLVLPALEAEVPPPQRARRFLNLWRLRDHPISRHDRGVVLSQVARMTGVSRELLEAKLTVVEDEIEALISELGDPASASRPAIQRCFTRAMAASRDREYWERIRRFPKSIELEATLTWRIELTRHRLIETESLLTELNRSAEPSETLRQANVLAAQRLTGIELELNAAHGNRDSLLAHGATAGESWEDTSEQSPANSGPVTAESFAPRDLELVRLMEDRRAAREWADWLGLLSSLLKRGDAAGVLTRITSELERLGGRTGEISEVETRLGHLRERTLTPWLSAWESRWPTTLVAISRIAESNPHLAGGLFDNPLLVAERVDRTVVEAIKVHASLLQGLTCEARTVRRYPLGSITQSLVGHTQLPDPATFDAVVQRALGHSALAEFRAQWFADDEQAMLQAFRGTIGGQPIGVTGVEGFHELRLAGTPGARAVYVDARGQERSIEGEWEPTATGDLQLTLDAELMAFAAETVRKWEPTLRQRGLSRFSESWQEVGEWRWALRGSLIVLDVETGAVVCMLDINDRLTSREGGLAGPVASDQAVTTPELPRSWRWWLEPANEFPRSTGGNYPPGSTFKIVSAIALLEDGVVSDSQTFDDVHSRYKIGSTWLRTSHPTGHRVDMPLALAASSNGYFWHASTLMGEGRPQRGYRETLLPWARALGFGELPGLDSAGLQTAGSLPDPTAVSPPDLALLSIGQGQMLASPLQVARMLAAVASRGRLTSPHLSAEGGGEAILLPVRESTWDTVHRGLIDCVHTSRGTAYKSRVLRRINAAGKTGTAQTGKFWSLETGKLASAKARIREGNGTPEDTALLEAAGLTPTAQIVPDLQIPDHAWFGGFAPFDKPKYAFVMLAEFSGLGGSEVADLVGEVVEFALKKDAAKAETAPVVAAGK